MQRKKVIENLIKYPHLLGHYFGYKLLTETHSYWIRSAYFATAEYCIQAHRGSYKTTSIIIIGAIWWLFFNWEDRILILRKDFTAASDVLKVISRILNSDKCHELFKFIHGIDYDLILDRDDKITWSLKQVPTAQANLNAYGIGQDLTGTHFDKALVDDFVTIKDRISKAEREKTKLYINDLRANIIDPGKFGIFAGTPWHKLDAWTLLPEPEKFDIYTAKIARFTKEHIQYLRLITTPSMFAANYELKHIASDEGLFSDPVYCKWDTFLNPVGHIDAKYKGSHTGAFTMMAKRPDGKIQAIGFMFTNHVADEYSRLYSIWQRYKCGTVYLEDNADKGYAARDLSNIGMMTKSYTEHENKFVKITQNLRRYWELIEWDEDTDPEYINQIMDTQEGLEPDDCADSAASLIRESGIINNLGVSIQAVEYQQIYKE